MNEVAMEKKRDMACVCIRVRYEKAMYCPVMDLDGESRLDLFNHN